MFVVTGGAGFIGSNIVKKLNDRGITDILVVDDLKDGHKFVNLVDCDFLDYAHKDDFLLDIAEESFHRGEIEAIFHEGACSATTEWDGHFMMQNNFEYSKILLHYCLDHGVPFLYASSAATYGESDTFVEERQHEAPANVYGFSKFQFDQYVRKFLPQAQSQVVGFRYFNVYGPREQHKGSMASVAFHHYQQMLKDGQIKLFGAYDGYEAGEQKRDFVYIDDVVDVNMWFYDHPEHSGIFNLGTGRSQPFNDIAKSVIQWFNADPSALVYIDFPEHLKGHYQSFTQADIANLRSTGCDIEFRTVEQGVKLYLDWLNRKK